MGFFNALRRVLSGENAGEQPVNHRLAEAWGLADSEVGPDHGEASEAGEYDRNQWRKRLKRVLAELPGSASEWSDLIADGKALGFESDWMDHCAREEFDLMVRRAVSDRVFTESEHRRLDFVRDLMGIPEHEAEERLHAVVAEAERFFGERIEGA